MSQTSSESLALHPEACSVVSGTEQYNSELVITISSRRYAPVRFKKLEITDHERRCLRKRKGQYLDTFQGKQLHPRSIKYGQFIGPKSHTTVDMLP
jgi:hypothetical protein